MAWTDALSTGFGKHMPVILQTEAAECGLACLAMVLSYHGVMTDLATLRQRHAISLKGITLATLVDLAQQEKLGTRALRLDVHELQQLRLPAVLHWELNHLLVLKKMSGDSYVVHDPAYGERHLSKTEMSRGFTGVALELWPATDFKPRQEKARISVGQLTGHIAGFWPSLTQIFLLSVALEIFGLVSPLFMQWVIDHVIVSRDADLLGTLTIGFMLLLFIQQGFGLVRSWILLGINTAIRVQWRSNVFSHLLRLPISYFQKRHLGDIVSRTDSVDQIQRVLTSALVETVFDGLLAVLTLVMMLIYSPQLAALAVVGALLYLAVRLLWYSPLYKATEEHIVRGAQLSTHFLETLRGVRAIKLFDRQTQRQTAWQSLLVNETNASLSIQKLQIFYGLANNLLSGIFNILLLWIGSREILANNLSVGMLLAFMAYRLQFNTRVTALISTAIDLKMLGLYAQRLADVVLTPAEAVDQRTSLAEQPAQQSIQVENLRFRYADHEPYVLDGLSLSIPAGQCVAITGGSGCGKTTLVHLLLGSLLPTQGAVRYGQNNISQIGIAQWRKRVATVMQDDTLFAGSLAVNISFFDAQPDMDRIAHCAHMAAIDTDIEAMPMGYQTLVGDMGTVLSGGQKQRVLLARALYKQPEILILDEATSHLDAVREKRVNAAIAQLPITRIVVAHRRETIATAQRVLEMDEGKIIFDGTPQAYFSQVAERLV